MRKIFKNAILALALMAAPSAFSQVSHGGEPLFNHSNSKVTTNTRYLPKMDNSSFIQQDVESVKGGTPMRIGMGQNCNIDVLKDAQVIEDMNGVHYLLAIESPEATFISLHFASFELADNAELFFYDKSGEFVLGKYTKSDKMKDGRFYTQSIPGSTAFIEYNVPAGAEPGNLVINSIMHGYKDIFGMIDGIYDDAEANLKGTHGNAEGDCHIDVACAEGDDWRQQIRSVVAIEITANTNYGSVSFMCSGALINNTKQDRMPYILSAFHCQDDDAMLEDLQEYYSGIRINSLDFTTYFLYQKNSCNGRTGNGNKSITGADIIAKYDNNSGSDMLLLKLLDTVPFEYKPFFAGWDRNDISTPEPGACIHHPGGDFKKISIPKKIFRSNLQNFHEVQWYSRTTIKGVTEEGSSGSPLFNADKRIIGQLFAGSSFCDYPEGTDFYGRIDVSWEGGGLKPKRLKDWLDPDNTNVTTLDGLDYTTDDPVAINTIDRNTKSLTVYPNPTRGMVYFDVDYIGKADYKVFDQNGRCVKEGTTVLTSTTQGVNISALPNGAYILTLRFGSKSYSAQVIKK